MVKQALLINFEFLKKKINKQKKASKKNNNERFLIT